MTPKASGRTIGLILIAQSALAPLVYLRMLDPVRRSTFLEMAAVNAPQIRVALLLSLLYGAMTMAVALVAWPVLRRQTELAALTFFTVTFTGVVALLIDNMGRYELLLGLGFVPTTIFPMVAVHLTLMVWLLARGFADRQIAKSSPIPDA